MLGRCTKESHVENGFVERFLVLWVCEPQQAGGTLEARLPKGKLRVDVLQYVKDPAESEGLAWNWIPFCGWQGFNLGNDIEASPQPCLQSSSTAASNPTVFQPGTSQLPWKDAQKQFGPQDTLILAGTKYFAANRLCFIMARPSFAAHLWGKIPKWTKVFSWEATDCFQDSRANTPYGQGGPPKYWLSSSAAQQLYEKFA